MSHEKAEGEQSVLKKVCLLGDPAVGKTSLVMRYVKNMFDEKYLATIGVNIYKKVVHLDNPKKAVTITLWDVVGQESFRTIQVSAINGSNGYIFVFDLSRPDTWMALQNWINKANWITGKKPSIILGNKSDLVDREMLKPENVPQVFRSYKLPLLFTSAKTGENVQKAFDALAKAI